MMEIEGADYAEVAPSRGPPVGTPIDSTLACHRALHHSQQLAGTLYVGVALPS